MDRLVGISVVLLIAVSIWAVMPSKPAEVVTSTVVKSGPLAASLDAQKTQPKPTTGAQGKNRVASNKTQGIPGVGTATLTRGSQRQMVPKDELPDMVDGEPINARVFSENPVSRKAKTETAPSEPVLGPYANVHWDGETDYADFEADLMKIYADRDSEGRLPKNIVASQVLRESVLRDLNVTSTTPVVMIGDYHPVHQDAITETLKRARKGQFLTGFTFADPNSTSDGRRVYVKVLQN